MGHVYTHPSESEAQQVNLACTTLPLHQKQVYTCRFFFLIYLFCKSPPSHLQNVWGKKFFKALTRPRRVVMVAMKEMAIFRQTNN
jgi:hypothetical protein